MPQQIEFDAAEEWAADDTENDCMSDEDFELPDDLEDEELPEDKVSAGPAGGVPVWRLIEMSRENSFLARELADFDDYDSFDGYSDELSGSYMH